MLKILLKIAANGFALYLASILITGVTFDISGENPLRDVGVLAFAGFVLWLGNSVIKPFIKVLTFPLIVVTLGLFNVAINMFILWGAALLIPQLTIEGFVELLLTTIIVSIINGMLFFI